MRNLILALGCTALVAPAVLLPTTVEAQRRYRDYDRDRDSRDGDRAREWRDDRGRARCRKSNGTTGLVVGGVGGALLGRAIDSRGDRTLGTVLGAGAGALAGRAVERGADDRCR